MAGLAAARSNAPAARRVSWLARLGAIRSTICPCPQCRTIDRYRRSSAARGPRYEVPYRMRPWVRPGWAAAKAIAARPPSERPNSTARDERAAAMTAATSRTRSWVVGSSAHGSDRPVTRLSSRISRPPRSSARTNRRHPVCCHWMSRCDTSPGTMTRSGGPLPQTWYAIFAALDCAYRVCGGYLAMAP